MSVETTRTPSGYALLADQVRGTVHLQKVNLACRLVGFFWVRNQLKTPFFCRPTGVDIRLCVNRLRKQEW